MELDPVVQKALTAGGKCCLYIDRFCVFKDESFTGNSDLFKAAEVEFDTRFTATQANIQHREFDQEKFMDDIWQLEEIFWVLCNIYANSPGARAKFSWYDYMNFAFDRLLYVKSMYNVATYGLNPPSYRRGIRQPNEPELAKKFKVNVFGSTDFNGFVLALERA